jgi:hypothetical protein
MTQRFSPLCGFTCPTALLENCPTLRRRSRSSFGEEKRLRAAGRARLFLSSESTRHGGCRVVSEIKHRNGLYWEGWFAHHRGQGVTSTNRDWIDGWNDREKTMARLVSSAPREPEYFEPDSTPIGGTTDPMTWTLPRSEAPWTAEQVEALNAHQDNGSMHPFTCPGDYEECEGHRELVATCNGWTCQCGRYTQTWAHAFMAGREE